MLLLYAGSIEFIYYWLYCVLYYYKLYSVYYLYYYVSFVIELIIGSVYLFMEYLMYIANFVISFIGTWAFGGGFIAMFYMYLFGFDMFNVIGYCNFEFILCWFMRLLLMKYLIYMLSYYSLYYSRVYINFCLFMSLYDYVYGIADVMSDELYEKVINGWVVLVMVFDVVFMVYGIELLSVFYLFFMLRSFSFRSFVS